MDEPPRKPAKGLNKDMARQISGMISDIMPDMLDFLRNPPPSPYPPLTYHRGAFMDFGYPSWADRPDPDPAASAEEIEDEEDRAWVRFLIRLVQHFGPRATNFAHHYYPSDDPDGLGAQAAAATGGAYEDTPYWTQGHGEASRVIEHLSGLAPNVPLSFPFYSLLLYDAAAASAIVSIDYSATRIGIYDIRDGDEAFVRGIAPPGVDVEIFNHRSERPY